eukprot:Nitzschia sp. Nitz4//scaffold83_size84149//32530//36503//NITZ4_005171-RA/size84149-processed-gene-0.73-mRNA-1//1//CDS//3329558938//827//frame0
MPQSDGLPRAHFPQTEEEADQVDAWIAREFGQLSMQERESILYDIHGVVATQQEDQGMIENKLQELELELSYHDKEAYDLASKWSTEYVDSNSFRLMFLRKEKYDTMRAAALIVRHFIVKQKLFGSGEILARPVQLSDLGAKEQHLLELGFVQMWPEKDSAGRTILFMETPRAQDVAGDDPNIHLRVVWYMTMKALDDEETQRKGLVWVISMAKKDFVVMPADQTRGMIETQAALPLSCSSQHFCYRFPEKRPYFTGLQMISEDHLRPRIRVHCGSPDEVKAKLQTFGIPTQHFPWTKDSTQCITTHDNWLAIQRAREALLKPLVGPKKVATSASFGYNNGGITPCELDVLFGRTALSRGHTGTRRAMHIVETNFDTYESLGRYQKMAMAEKIVSDIQQKKKGGIFLACTGSTDDEYCRSYLAYCMQELESLHNTSLLLLLPMERNTIPEDSSPQVPPVQARALQTNRFPQTEEEASRADALLAKELERLSIKEREVILYDIHGVSDAKPEDPLVVEQKLLELDRELNKCRHDNDAFKKAIVLNRPYAASSSFRLLFLRKERFDVQRAAQLITRHFEIKRKLFGDGDVLARPVYQSDLGEREIQSLQSGFVRLWPGRDSAGRAVIFLETPKSIKPSCDNFHYVHYRVAWYMAMKALEDAVTQRIGAVWVVSLEYKETEEVSVEQSIGMNTTQAVVPLNILSQHFCYQHPEKRPYLTGLHMFAEDSMRPRTRLHCGSPNEVKLKLQTFGIPTDHFPWTQDPVSCLKTHQKWLDAERLREGLPKPEVSPADACSPDSGDYQDQDVITPQRFDVLFGRTIYARRHTGTLRAMHIIEMNFESYEKSGRYQKMEMAEKIVKNIQECEGRFLRQDESGD